MYVFIKKDEDRKVLFVFSLFSSNCFKLNLYYYNMCEQFVNLILFEISLINILY